jgi:hypothetical protein
MSLRWWRSQLRKRARLQRVWHRELRMQHRAARNLVIEQKRRPGCTCTDGQHLSALRLQNLAERSGGQQHAVLIDLNLFEVLALAGVEERVRVDSRKEYRVAENSVTFGI